MNKTELVKEMAIRNGLTQRDNAKVLETFAATVGEVVSQGDEVSIMGFGSFFLKKRDARKGMAFGKEIDIPASKSVGFKPGKSLKDAVN